MAKRISVSLRDSKLAKKLNKIMEHESISKFIQFELCKLAGIDKKNDTKVSKYRTRHGLKGDKTTIYLDTDAEFALVQLKKRDGGFNIQSFIRQKIEERYSQLFEN